MWRCRRHWTGLMLVHRPMWLGRPHRCACSFSSDETERRMNVALPPTLDGPDAGPQANVARLTASLRLLLSGDEIERGISVALPPTLDGPDFGPQADVAWLTASLR